MVALTALKLLRLRKGLTQLELSQATNVPAVWLSLYERRRLPFKEVHARALAQFFGVSAAKLTSEDEGRNEACQA